MERKTFEGQKKTSQIKLPVIQAKKGESSKVLSTTMPDSCRARPSSLHKVEDLEKKLFEKLDSYEIVARKNTRKVTKKKGEGENNGEKAAEGYERMQKLMPGLYSKLIETKRGSPGEDVISTEPDLYVTQPKVNKLPSTADQPRRASKIPEQNNSPTFEGQQQILMGQEQLQELYREYSRRQQLPPQTSKKELQMMGQNLATCQKQIEDLTKSMEALIRELGQECIAAFEQSQQ